ncbi:MAG: ATP-binding cassette domain-containing protein [Planctomycetota bacterium]|nr:ATP-binding cassette domain-containing protein [Planctomycetota bacterium]
MPVDKDNDDVVRTVGLAKVFRDFWLREKVAAVRDLNLNIRAGEIYGLLGPNGSGKSTTLKIILSLLYPTRGRVTVFGKSPSDVRTKARIGFLPEESYLYPFLDANETLDYYGRLFGQPRWERRRRIGMLLDMVGLTGSAYRRIGEYSKGMQRRIGMAQALINDPDLLILDEPTSGMDPLASRQFKDLISELSRRGKTIILSSHLLADTEDVCDRVGILFAGQLRSEGTLEDLLSRASLTQIVTERLDETTSAAVRRVLVQADKRVISVESPKDKLEALFLRIVRQAQTRFQSSDSVKTGEVAEFLRAAPDQTPRKIIEELLAGPETPSDEPDQKPEAPPPSRTKPDSSVITELLGNAEKVKPAHPPSKEAPPQPMPERQKNGPVDRSVIDDLIRSEGTEGH